MSVSPDPSLECGRSCWMEWLDMVWKGLGVDDRQGGPYQMPGGWFQCRLESSG